MSASGPSGPLVSICEWSFYTAFTVLCNTKIGRIKSLAL